MVVNLIKNSKQIVYINIILTICLLFFNINHTFAQGLKLRVYGVSQRTFMYSKNISDDLYIARMKTYWPNESFNIERDPSYNFGAGIQFKRYFNKRLAIGYGLQYSPIIQKFHYLIFFSGQNNAGSIILNYLKLPVLLEFDIVSKVNFSLFISGGAQLSMLTSDRGSIPVYLIDTNSLGLGKGLSFDLFDPGTVYKDFTFDGVLAIGMEKRLIRQTYLFIQPRFDFSFTNVYKEEFREQTNGLSIELFDSSNISIKSKHNISIGIVSGLSFIIK